jgi:hypothetical protein
LYVFGLRESLVSFGSIANWGYYIFFTIKYVSSSINTFIR